jgi:tetratricopeptide (TPR) repeat protein
MSEIQRRVFVIMPFGKKPARPTHKIDSIDFDSVYSRIIQPAARRVGWNVLRIDEVTESGPIAHQYLKEIFSADLVVADISIPNATVFYELGIRHSISTGGTIILAVRGTELPFDIAHLRVLFYDCSDNGFEEARLNLQKAISAYQPGQAVDTNPIRGFLEHLGVTSSPASSQVDFEQELDRRISRARNLEQLIAVWQWAQNLRPLPALPLLVLADRLSDFEAWQHSVEILRAALEARPGDYEICRQLGWHLRHLGRQYEPEAIQYFEQALTLNPGDPETLGMLAGLRKRRREYEQAAQLYERGALLSPQSLYMRVNQAAMEMLRDPKGKRGIELYQALYLAVTNDPTRQADGWTELVLGEAAYALGRVEEASRHFRSAAALGSAPKDLRSAADQLQLLGAAGLRGHDATGLASLLRDLASPTLHVREPALESKSSQQKTETP